MSDSALVPLEQKNIVFYDDEITAVVALVGDERVVYVPLRPICDYLGLAWPGQYQRIKRDPVLSDVVMSVTVTITDMDPVSRRPHTSEVMAIPLDYLNGWLFGLNADRVKPESREKVIAYQRDCYRVLARHFSAVSIAPTSPTSTLMQVRDMGLAIVRMAEEQIEFDRRLGHTETAVTNLDKRLHVLEEKLEPPAHAVSEDQASQLSQAVKAVAVVLGKQTQRNEFGGIYGELYRKFGITSYKMLPQKRFAEAMAWLSEWHQSLTGDVPF